MLFGGPDIIPLDEFGGPVGIVRPGYSYLGNCGNQDGLDD